MAFLADNSNFGMPRGAATKALTTSVGLASPLWLMFGAAASAGAAMWWMTRWTRPTAPVVAAPTVAPEPAPPPVPAPSVQAAVEAPVLEAVAAPIEEAGPDELTRLFGVGPRLADALVARGVTRFAQLAKWTDEDVAKFDAELKLKGRVARDAWVDQARRFAAEA